MKKIHNIKIEPLTAVHIGTGETLTPLDYVVIEVKRKNAESKDMYMKFSSDNMLSRLMDDKDKRDALRKFEAASVSGDIRELQKFFHTNFTADDLDYPCDVTEEFLHIYKSKTSENPVDNALEVLQMYRPAGSKNPVIPGSSIKGAIRTALLNLKMSYLNDECYDELETKLKKSPEPEKEEQFIQKKVFSYSDAKNDPMRTVVFSDTIFPSKNTQIVGLLENVAIDKNKGELKPAGMQIAAEALKGNLLEGEAVGESKIVIDEDLQKEKQSRISARITIDDIINACNYFYKSEFDEEYEKFYEPCSDRVDVITKLKKQIDEISSQKNQFVFRVGRWSQVEFVTFEENFRRPKAPTGKSGGTRTLLDYNGNFVPMGWCKCTVLN